MGDRRETDWRRETGRQETGGKQAMGDRQAGDGRQMGDGRRREAGDRQGDGRQVGDRDRRETSGRQETGDKILETEEGRQDSGDIRRETGDMREAGDGRQAGEDPCKTMRIRNTAVKINNLWCDADLTQAIPARGHCRRLPGPEEVGGRDGGGYQGELTDSQLWEIAAKSLSPPPPTENCHYNLQVKLSRKGGSMKIGVSFSVLRMFVYVLMRIIYLQCF